MRPDVRSLAEAASTPWDVIIIGGGVAGGAAACRAVANGLRTLLVERARFPRAKVCGCCLTPAGIAWLEASRLESAFAGTPTLRRMRLSYAGQEVNFALPAYRVVDRERFDAHLLDEAARRGATIMTRTAAVVTPDDRVRLTSAASTSIVDAKVILACDGLGGSSLRERPEFEWSISKASRMGLGATLASDAADLGEGELRMLCSKAGYLGLVRRRDGSIDAAAAIDPAMVRAAASASAAAVALCEGDSIDLASVAGATWTGTPLLTRRRRRVACGRVLAAGDAAGYVEPFTGEGMTWALQGGAAAADLAAGIVAGHDRAETWNDLHAELLAGRRRRCGVVASVVRRPWVMRSLVAMGSVSPGAMRIAAAFVTGGGA